jgi:hypothetical protein
LNFGTNLGGRSGVTFPIPTSSQILFRYVQALENSSMSNLTAISQELDSFSEAISQTKNKASSTILKTFRRQKMKP